MDEYIFGLQIPVHDIVSIEHPEGLENLAQEPVGLGLGETAVFLDHLVEGAAIAELVNKIIIVGGFEHIDVGDYVGAFVAYLGQNVDFVDGALLQLGRILELLRRDHLYGELLACDDVLGLVDFGEGALAHQLHEHVLLHCFTHADCAFIIYNNYYWGRQWKAKNIISHFGLQLFLELLGFEQELVFQSLLDIGSRDGVLV